MVDMVDMVYIVTIVTKISSSPRALVEGRSAPLLIHLSSKLSGVGDMCVIGKVRKLVDGDTFLRELMRDLSAAILRKDLATAQMRAEELIFEVSRRI